MMNESVFTIKDDLIRLNVFGKAAFEDVLMAQYMLENNLDKTHVDQLDCIRDTVILPTGEVAFYVVESELLGWGLTGFPPTSIVRNDCARLADCFINNRKNTLDFMKSKHFPGSVNRILCTHWYIMYHDENEAIKRFGPKAFGRINCPYDPFLTAQLKAAYEKEKNFIEDQIHYTMPNDYISKDNMSEEYLSLLQ